MKTTAKRGSSKKTPQHPHQELRRGTRMDNMVYSVTSVMSISFHVQLPKGAMVEQAVIQLADMDNSHSFPLAERLNDLLVDHMPQPLNRGRVELTDQFHGGACTYVIYKGQTTEVFCVAIITDGIKSDLLQILAGM